MTKTVFFSTLLLSAIVLLNPVSAQPARGQDKELPSAAQKARQIRQEEIIQNQGEEQNLQIENTLEGEAGEALQDGELIEEQVQSREAALLKARGKFLTLEDGSRIVKQKNNDVAQKVQELLLAREEEDWTGGRGIGEQVRVIAQNQLKGQEEIQNRLNKLENKPVWHRFFLGQDQEEVEEVEDSLEDNEERLEELQTILEDENLSVEDQLALEEAFLELQAQQELIETHLGNILGEFNVAGFFKRMFNRS